MSSDAMAFVVACLAILAMLVVLFSECEDGPSDWFKR